ncbi:NitT/TauT family transport system substrate-binding protein [Rhodoferax sp. OV413]|uniref:ABC transporter substrate-binding protein n=1 Tax=Rhodoferax sp. OV413 TaxID=1855285 RepID=UPI00088CDE49|nr:ABC transporter substrate-binding protein [Rhodoferax sp. OV413]SDO05866.1 NitT/TauT family transport system substrate-binding protein [Rhodoferax sp. OV413]
MLLPSLHRRSFLASTALVAAAVVAPALRAQNKLEKVKLALAVDGEAALYHLPLTIADQLGYFRAEGLELEISDLVGGARSPQTVPGSAVDVFAGAFESTISHQSKNQFYQAFVQQGRAPQIALGISARNLPAYQSVADLRGKLIGVPALGTPAHMLANVVLARAGVPSEEVRFIGVGTAAGALQALRTGQLDAISNIDPVMGMLEQKGEVKIIADTRTLKGTLEVFGSAMPAACLYASQEFIQKNPNTVQALTNAMVHGLKWLQTAGPSDIIKLVPESYFLGDRATYLAAFNKSRETISIDGLLPEDGPKTALKALGSFDPVVKAAKIDLAKTYTNVFALRAKQRFRA